eukprot:8838247-Pyramimonas_sp.AAC.1
MRVRQAAHEIGAFLHEAWAMMNAFVAIRAPQATWKHIPSISRCTGQLSQEFRVESHARWTPTCTVCGHAGGAW